jgi:translation initiation factor 2 beta subunit (eIF-2beta)/eIF-5
MPNAIEKQQTCPKCGSPKTQVIGTSPSPPVTYVRCQACGHTSGVAQPAVQPKRRP